MEKKSWEMELIFYVFILLCIATLADIIPGVDGSTWATRLYGIICLAGVIFCARRKGMFMAIDAFTGMYPAGLQRALQIINQLLMILLAVVLTAAVILGFMNFLNTAGSSIEETYTKVLYVLSIITYPVALLYLIRQLFEMMKKSKKEEE